MRYMCKWFFTVSHSSILLYQDFLEKYIIEISRQNIERKKYQEKWQPDVIPLIMVHLIWPFAIKMQNKFNPIGICPQYFMSCLKKREKVIFVCCCPSVCLTVCRSVGPPIVSVHFLCRGCTYWYEIIMKIGHQNM